MQYTGAIVKKLPSGGFKACVWGQPDMHIMDWNGCNYRIATIPGQPLFGYKTQQEAVNFVKSKYETEKDLINHTEKDGDGAFMQENIWDDAIDIKWKKKP